MTNAVEVNKLGKMYRLFEKNSDRVKDIFGIDKLRFWDRTPRYREFWALRNVDLVIPKGERIGIIGRNGAGKSTLLKLIVGNLKPTEGDVKVHGKIQALLQMGTGFHPEFTGLENIRTALAYAGMDARSVRNSVEEIVDFSELEDYINQPVKYYSAGMYSRLAFAVATSLVPDILVIDEVLGAGDAAFMSKCADRMKRLTQDSGATVLFVSHSMDSVLEICNRAVLIERGEVVKDGTALEVSKIYNKKIRDEEELRAKAKEYKVSRKSMISIASADEATKVLIMRFVGDNPHPRYSHFIFEAKLSSGGETLSELHFGAPTDDDPAQFTHVITDNGADWGPAKHDRGGYYRAYCNKDGQNCHAPFQMSVPVYLGTEQMHIAVQARPDTREPIYLEYFDGREYHRLGAVGAGQTEFDFRIAPEEASEADAPAQDGTAADAVEEGKDAGGAQPDRPAETDPNAGEDRPAQPAEAKDAATPAREQAAWPGARDERRPMPDPNAGQEVEADDYEKLVETNSVYGSQKIFIEKMDILDANGRSARAFDTGDSMLFRIDIGVREAVPSFIGVVCIMTRDGKVVTQTFCDSHELGLSQVNRKVTLEAGFSPIRFGEGEYMVSIGLFQTCDMSRAAEEPSYCVADRALFFKVQQPFGIRKYLGGMLHPCEWRCGDGHSIFDGVNYKEQDL